MPREFFREINGIDYHLNWSTYQTLKDIQPAGLVSYLLEGRPEINRIGLELPDRLRAAIVPANPNITIITHMLDTPHGRARLQLAHTIMPQYPRDLLEIMTMGDVPTSKNPAASPGLPHPVMAARYVHLLMHNTLLLINDHDYMDVFVEDDTLDQLDNMAKAMGDSLQQRVDEYIGWYREDMAALDDKRIARLN